MRYIIDTNVALVANGSAANVKPECRLATIDFLEKMMVSGRLVVDTSGEIESEYRKKLDTGMPGVGNRFLQAFFSAAVRRIERVNLPKDKNGEFQDFPNVSSLRRFDKSDRKFAALCRKSKAPIANAVDSDWSDHKTELQKHGVKIEFICTCDSKNWFAEN